MLMARVRTSIQAHPCYCLSIGNVSRTTDNLRTEGRLPNRSPCVSMALCTSCIINDNALVETTCGLSHWYWALFCRGLNAGPAFPPEFMSRLSWSVGPDARTSAGSLPATANRSYSRQKLKKDVHKDQCPAGPALDVVRSPTRHQSAPLINGSK